MKTQPGHLRAALLFLAPNFLGFAVFTLVPTLLCLGGSFTNWSLRPTVPLRFVGLQNYLTLLWDHNFYFYLFNTLYLMLGIPVAIVGALLLATSLAGKLQVRRRGRRYGYAAAVGGVSCAVALGLYLTGSANLTFVFLALGVISTVGLLFDTTAYRTFYYLPFFTSGAGTILLWVQLYNPRFGLINHVIQDTYTLLHVHADPPGWLTSTRSLLGFLPLPAFFNNGGFGLGARESIMIMGIWAGIGGNNMLLYLAALANISPELYEASDIDGASAWQRLRYITIPQLAPTTFFITIMSVVGGLQGGFEQAQLMTLGGPAGVTTTLSYYIYTQGFERLDLGYGCAVAWVLFLLILVLTLLNWRVGSREIA